MRTDSYVYRHFNKITGECFYVGSGTGGKYYARAHTSYNRTKYWKRYVAKYEGFRVEIFKDRLTYEQAIQIEIEEIKKHGRKKDGGTLVNILRGGSCPSYGKKRDKPKIVTQETREKLRAINLGKKHSEETKKKVSLASTGKKLSPEHIEKLREFNKGNKHRLGKSKSDEERRKISIGLTGKKLSPERKEKMRVSRIGKRQTEATKQKCREWSTGRHHDEETRKKMSLAQMGNQKWLGKKHTPETIEKLRIAAKQREERKRNLKLTN